MYFNTFIDNLQKKICNNIKVNAFSIIDTLIIANFTVAFMRTCKYTFGEMYKIYNNEKLIVPVRKITFELDPIYRIILCIGSFPYFVLTNPFIGIFKLFNVKYYRNNAKNISNKKSNNQLNEQLNEDENENNNINIDIHMTLTNPNTNISQCVKLFEMVNCDTSKLNNNTDSIISLFTK